jgi:uncharacterized protein DUF1207
MSSFAFSAASGESRIDDLVARDGNTWSIDLLKPRSERALTSIEDQAPEVLPQSTDAATANVSVTPEEPVIDGESDWVDVEEWTWQWVPSGVIYHSYMAGPHEPRMALVSFYDSQDDGTFWDASLGGRVGFLRYGTADPFRPQGWELDFYGAAIARLDVEHREDLNSCDYVFGFPLTYGVGDWQFKFGYAHLSSHLGDEYARRVPGALADRINYVRDALVYGASVYALPFWRQYGEMGWAFNTDGGARPWEFQFGTELARPGSFVSSPFLAVNADVRQDQNYSGNLAAQTGWLWRGEYGQTLRLGLHYLTGKSNQYEFYYNSTAQTGVGIWYDF